MSSPTPDLSALSLNAQRIHDTHDYDAQQAATARQQQYHFSPSPPLQSHSYSPMGISPSPLKMKPARSGLPSQWLDTNTMMPDSRSLSPNNASDFSSSGGSPPSGHLSAPPLGPPTPGQGNPDDEIIPTAIVIKNIPFNVKRETLLDIIASLAIPTPYAFNYHLDQQGAFRGLAFANFRQAIDADAVVAALNGFDVQGRKLRVEYKKVLQAGEKERIEREKALRRMRSMQLEKEQQQAAQQQVPGHGPYDEFGAAISPSFMPAPQRSYSQSSYQQSTYSPPPISQLPSATSPFSSAASPPVGPSTPNLSDKTAANTELDLNDPSTLEIYSRILLFKDDPMRDELAFSRTLSPKQRRVVHLIAQKLGVYHYSVGEGDERYAVVTRIDPNRVISNLLAQRQPGTLSRAPSAYLSPTSSQSQMASSLRMKKSMPDMKTLHTQSPRLASRASNGNIREGYATIASPARRSPGGFGALFGNAGVFGSSGGIPPVPSLPASVSSLNSGGINEGPGSGVMRQPRGPGVDGFASRRGTNTERGNGLEARSHEPLEI
ncbi:hypothetical protein CONPUDRAFT_118133 [Coniophora puteana RWD-64-598 SS2]|uniref:Uncharacterized protein n=1 Tax=Coniophora puteana (strain RWD-64-598) TaxID=741705 RepID=A0A5M3N2V1_CONPW|nr:uncharacterized protein CONPUDRAFT_118133 [Coniophora puteana RWD-64-598 SS2]EIW85354.1 hypothetical protein CONPUDRAFT_118133 [Coniophora puteana RWD-64-598 SS2]